MNREGRVQSKIYKTRDFYDCFERIRNPEDLTPKIQSNDFSSIDCANSKVQGKSKALDLKFSKIAGAKSPFDPDKERLFGISMGRNPTNGKASCMEEGS